LYAAGSFVVGYFYSEPRSSSPRLFFFILIENVSSPDRRQRHPGMPPTELKIVGLKHPSMRISGIGGHRQSVSNRIGQLDRFLWKWQDSSSASPMSTP
jgi:hypothetical protein